MEVGDDFKEHRRQSRTTDSRGACLPHRVLALPAAARAQTAVVPAFPCAVIFGGQWTVPAGHDVVVAQRWEAKNRGLVQTFLNARTTTLSINGGAALDISGEYVPISAAPGGTYFTRVAHDSDLAPDRTRGTGLLRDVIAIARSRVVLARPAGCDR